MLAEVIGKPAMLEQTAEELCELAKACLKMARDIRGENDTHKAPEQIKENYLEELADVSICLQEMNEAGYFTTDELEPVIQAKQERMKRRIEAGKENIEACHVKSLKGLGIYPGRLVHIEFEKFTYFTALYFKFADEDTYYGTTDVTRNNLLELAKCRVDGNPFDVQYFWKIIYEDDHIVTITVPDDWRNLVV